MREQLRELEGKLVCIQGRPTEAKDNGNGRDICLRMPKVVPWDANAALDFKGPAVKCDHLWIRAIGAVQLSMYQDSLAVARVGYYTRTDGSFDIGCQRLSRLFNMDRAFALLDDAKKIKSKDEWLMRANVNLHDIEVMLESHGRMLKDAPMYVYSEYVAVSTIKEKIKKLRAELDRYNALSVLENAPKTSKVKPGFALFLGNQFIDSSLPVSSVDRLLGRSNV